MPGYAPQAAFARSRELFARMEEWLDGPEAARLEHAALEEQLAARGREMLRLLLQDHLDLRAAREPRREQVTGPDGAARTRAEPGHSRPLSTVFGQVEVSRIAYRAPGARNVHPADAELNLPPGKHSHGLGKQAAAGAARGSFGQARADVARQTGSKLGKRQCEQLTRRAAADFEDFYTSSHRPPPGAAPGDVLALSCDGKGIVILPGQLRPAAARNARKAVPKQDGRLSRGEVRNRKRMAETGAVFDFAPVPRTADAILDPGRQPPGPAANGSPPASPTTPPLSWPRCSPKLTAAIPPASAPGSRWPTATSTRSSGSRPKPPPAASPSPSSATSSTSLNTCGPPPGASSPKPAPTPAPGSARTPQPSCTARPATWPQPSAATSPPPASSPPPPAKPPPEPRTTSTPKPPTWTTRKPSQPAGPSPALPPRRLKHSLRKSRTHGPSIHMATRRTCDSGAVSGQRDCCGECGGV